MPCKIGHIQTKDFNNETYWDSVQTLHIQPCHIKNLGLFRTQAIFKSLSNMYGDHAYSLP